MAPPKYAPALGVKIEGVCNALSSVKLKASADMAVFI